MPVNWAQPGYGLHFNKSGDNMAIEPYKAQHDDILEIWPKKQAIFLKFTCALRYALVT